MSSTFQLVLYTVNIVFLTTSLYSWVMKRFHIPLAYKDNFGELFPARRTLASMYLLQLTEIPYLFVMDKPEGLFYVNAIALLVFSFCSWDIYTCWTDKGIMSWIRCVILMRTNTPTTVTSR